MKFVLSTCGAKAAPTLARQLVQERLAACCNMLGQVESVYWWQGELTQDSETLLVFKTADDRLDALMYRLAEIHPYDVPEILAFDAIAGFNPYLEWLERETRPEKTVRSNRGESGSPS